MRLYYFLLFMFWSSMLLFSSCKDNTVYEKNYSLEKGLWEAEKPLQFQATIKDTAIGYNVYLNLRNAGTYPYSNIFLFINTRFPGGMIDRDTVEIMLATPEGKWMGQGLGDLWDNQILFKRNVTFPEPGEYKFEITHAMRANPLTGILDGGMRIETVVSK